MTNPANDTRHEHYALVENHPDGGRRYGVVVASTNHLVACWDEREYAERFYRESNAMYDNSIATAKRMGMI